MDNLRFATVNPPRKPGRVPRPAGCPASLSSGGQTPRIVPGTKPLVVGLPPKSLSTLFRNRCPVSTGITVQFRPESVSSLLRNTHPRPRGDRPLASTKARPAPCESELYFTRLLLGWYISAPNAAALPVAQWLRTPSERQSLLEALEIHSADLGSGQVWVSYLLESNGECPPGTSWIAPVRPRRR